MTDLEQAAQQCAAALLAYKQAIAEEEERIRAEFEESQV